MSCPFSRQRDLSCLLIIVEYHQSLPLSYHPSMVRSEAKAAVELLQSLGVRHLCGEHSLEMLEDILPPCSDYLNDNDDDHEFDWDHFITNAIGATFMLLVVSLISGLFLGLLTLDLMDLQIVIRASLDEDERVYASNILPVVKDRHRLLVTLLFVNALAYESLPLFLDQLVPNWVAVLMSTTLILVFGEILPSGIFTGPQQLYLGSKFIPFARFFLWVLYPIAVPLARWLDHLTETNQAGQDHVEEYTRDELSALVQIQHERRMKVTHRKEIKQTNYYKIDANSRLNPTWSDVRQEIMEAADDTAVEQLHPPLHQREVDIIQGALQLKTNSAMDIYTPWAHVYAVPDNLVLDKNTIMEIYSHGYSRVPVYRYNKEDPSNTFEVLGFLITRQLMLIDADDERVLSTLPLQRPTCVSPKTNLVDLFDTLQTNGLLLTFVCASPVLANRATEKGLPIPDTAGLMGIVTLVDVLESVLQNRIYDEGDIRERDRAVAILQQWASKKLQSFMRKTADQRRRRLSKLPSMEDDAKAAIGEETPLLLGDGQHSIGYNGTTSR